MRKILLFIFFISLFFISNNNAFSGRYGLHSVSYGTSGATTCNDDSDGISDPRYVSATGCGQAASGNMSCYYWDNSSPTGTSTYSPSGWTSGNVTVSVPCSDTGGSGCQQGTYSTVVTTNKSGNITISDNAGNTRSVSYTVSNIDRTSPNGGTVSKSPSGWTSGNVTVSVSCSDSQSGCQQSNYSVVVSSNSSGNITIRDNAGNTRSIPYTVSNIDKTAPSGTISYTNGWINSTSNNINLNLYDSQSGFKSYTLEYATSSDNPIFSSFGAWQPLETKSISGTNYAGSVNFNGVNNKAYKFRLTVYDNVNNIKQYITSTNILKIDTTNPNSVDITTATSNQLLATNSQNFDINVSNNSGSPITYISTFFEYYNSTNSFNGTFETSNNGIWSKNENIQNVDLDRGINGGREYSLRVSKICDEAGNCVGTNLNTSDLKTFKYDVYANTKPAYFNPGLIGTGIVSFTDLNNPNNIADASDKYLKITLLDKFGNEIIHSNNIDGINRIIDLNFNYDNYLNTNQYNKIGTGVYSTVANKTTFADNFNLGPNNSIFYNEISEDGTYEYKFKILAPTYLSGALNGQELVDPDAEFVINYITVDIYDSIGGTNTGITIGDSNIITKAEPIYYTDLSGALIDDGVVEGSEQDSSLDVNINSGSVGTLINKRLYIEFGSGETNETSSNLNLNANLPNLVGGSGSVGEGFGILVGNDNKIINNNIVTTPIKTLLTLDGGLLDIAISKSYISSHISYTLKNTPNFGENTSVVYNSFVYGKPNYFYGVPSITTYTEGLKVIGKTHSLNQLDLSSNQGAEDIHILGNIEKSSLKEQIVKNVYNVVKNLEPDTVGLNQNILDLYNFGSNDGNNQNSNILYFGNDLFGPTVTIDSSANINGQKTIVAIGKNIYIKNNIEKASNDNNSILGIISLKDDNGNGGNIYIDPEVQIINATLYADRSLISYDGSNELDGTASQSLLNNQLYINGSVFSENTIGGSRMIPNPICPFYVNTTCDLNTAQKFDLNYLRRYFVGGSGTPINNGETVLTPSSPYYNYPIVIKYNPIIQVTPPPFFESN